MPTELDTVIIPEVIAILKQYGVKATLVMNANSFNVSTGRTAKVETSYTVLLTPPSSYALRFVDGDAILNTDVRVYMAGGVLPNSVKPVPGSNMVLADGREYEIIAVGYIYSGELVALYDIQLR